MTPNPVQEASASHTRIRQLPFFFVICQHGVESVIKHDLLNVTSPLRLAFSRPGFLTLKWAGDAKSTSDSSANLPPEPAIGVENTDLRLRTMQQLSEHWAIRLAGGALGNLRGDDATDLVEQVLRLAVEASVADGCVFDAVHVFERDRNLPGSYSFEPGPTELSEDVARLIGQRLQADPPCAGFGSGIQVNSANPSGEAKRVLDVVLVEPNQWLVGWHVAGRGPSCWPGGVLDVVPPTEMISRAYLKMAEALAWSELPVEAGDKIVEIGCAPGGSCQRLLDLGLHVTGVDPAEMDPLLVNHSRFEHWRGKAAQIRRKQYAKFRWLAADANVAPNYTLDFVEEIVNYRTSRFEGLLLTLKLSSYNVAEHLDQYLDRVRSWGFEHVAARQLASNRRECCVMARRGES